jgi:hypothetical protein
MGLETKRVAACNPSSHLMIETDTVSKMVGSVEYRMIDEVKKLSNPKWEIFLLN